MKWEWMQENSLEDEAGNGVLYLGYVGYGGSDVSGDIEDKYRDLIAASPELYSALDALLKVYVSAVVSGNSNFGDPDEEKVVVNARAALAKARFSP